MGFEGDVRKREDAKRVVKETVKHFGKLDILVNAAAGNFLVSAEDLSPNGFKTGPTIETAKNPFFSVYSIILSFMNWLGSFK